MHFYTAPNNQLYTNRLQLKITPFALIPMVYYTNIDIGIMGGLVFIQNAYVCNYIVDVFESPDEYLKEIENLNDWRINAALDFNELRACF